MALQPTTEERCVYVRYPGHETGGCQTKDVKGIEIIPAGNAGGNIVVRHFVALEETVSVRKWHMNGRKKKSE